MNSSLNLMKNSEEGRETAVVSKHHLEARAVLRIRTRVEKINSLSMPAAQPKHAE